MSKKNKVPPKREEYKPAEYYKLKTKAVNDLAEADVSNSPEVSDAELRKYRSGFKFKIPDLVKICFVKWWFPAAVCFFFFWGLGNYVPSMLDLLFITGLALGVVTDILTNNALRFLEPYPGAWKKWIMFYKKEFITYVWNILYALVDLFCVYATYSVINYAVMRLRHLESTDISLAVEPILFGFFFMGYDMLFLLFRNTFRSIVKDARKPGR